jgi:hypothetical protein
MFVLRFVQRGQFFKEFKWRHTWSDIQQSNLKSFCYRLRKDRLLTNDVYKIDISYSVLSVNRGNGGEQVARINEKPKLIQNEDFIEP